MKRSKHRTNLLFAAAVLAGCTGTTPRPNIGATGTLARANAFVLDRSQLGNPGGALLDAMIGRLPGFRVSRSSSCPAVSLRGAPNSVPGITDPLVYVDGTRTLDTCVLEMLRAADVERVEVYPLGVTPGYQGNAHGLILVFTRGR